MSSNLHYALAIELARELSARELAFAVVRQCSLVLAHRSLTYSVFWILQKTLIKHYTAFEESQGGFAWWPFRNLFLERQVY